MLFLALVMLLLCQSAAHAQSQPSQPVPDAPAPTGTPTTGTPIPAGTDKDPNFKPDPDVDKFKYPEIARPAAPPEQRKGTADDFPFPGESGTSKPADKTQPESPAADENGLPAGAPGNIPGNVPAPATSGGFSSSATLHDEGSGGVTVAENPARVKEDAKIARFYWNQGNYEGAYLRYKDAVVYAPQDAEMWFQLAEAERQLGRYVQSRKDYEHCAELSPTGNRAKEATRWTRKLPDKDKPQPDRPGPKVP